MELTIKAASSDPNQTNEILTLVLPNGKIMHISCPTANISFGPIQLTPPTQTEPVIIRRELIPDDASLEAKTLIDVISQRRPEGWDEAFVDAWKTLVELSDILQEQEKAFGAWFPRKNEIFRCLELVKPEDVRVIIIGQDPYHAIGKTGFPQAMGMAFSVRVGEPIPSSLKNIFLELSSSIPSLRTPQHGNLTRWAQQGVLLLNSCLTVRQGTPKSHGDVWKGFVQSVLKIVERHNPKCVAMLWGAAAQKLKTSMPGRAHILEAVHPSGLNNGREKRFTGCKHFVLCNEYLVKTGQTPIDWNVDDPVPVVNSGTPGTPTTPSTPKTSETSSTTL